VALLQSIGEEGEKSVRKRVSFYSLEKLREGGVSIIRAARQINVLVITVTSW
jgi:hypothetical protein